ncbi:MAG: glycoside hydrolase family 127 protein, partial [Actinobacteria bacterium]|nr:glycoside hydrolase family 127 protein [Actinomycetota bacterium]
MSEVERKYEDFKIGEIIPRGWIYEQLRRDRDGFVGHLDELANEEVGSRIFISNDSKEFIDKNMQNDKEHNWWNGESEGNWLDAIINLAYLLDSEELKQKIHSYVSELLRVKGDESYLGVYPSGYRYVEEFIDGELWTQSRIILAMLSYYTTTNNSEVLELIKKAADKTVEICTKKFKTSGIFNYRNLNAWGHGLMIVEP